MIAMLRPGFAAACCFILAVLPPPVARAAGCDKPTFRIIVDVGHSATAPGAISARGATEYSFNLALSALIERRLVAHGYGNVFRMITPGDAGNVVERARRANSMAVDLFLSVHHDSAQPQYFERWIYAGQERSYSDRFKGWSLFVSYANAHLAESIRFATLLADRLAVRGLPFTTHHAEAISGERRGFVDASRGIYRHDGLAVLKLTNAPAVLMEAGLIINRDEEAALAAPARQNAIAEAVAEAVDVYCSGKK